MAAIVRTFHRHTASFLGVLIDAHLHPRRLRRDAERGVRTVDASQPRADVTLSGPLDLAAHPTLSLAVSEALAGSPDRVTVDLAGVTFLDCGGVGALLRAHRLAERAGARLELVAVSPTAALALRRAAAARPYPPRALVLP